MKRMKKLFALLMTLAMVMGLSVTAMAGDSSVTITVNNATNAKFVTAQVVVADPDKDTGWEIATNYVNYFTTAFEETDTQKIIKGMIYAKNPQASKAEKIEDFANKYATALANIVADFEEANATSETITASSAGLYVIQGYENNYNYSPMAVFVGMDMETGKPNGLLTPQSVNAKKAPNTAEKTSDDADKVVEIGKTVEYSVTSTVPYFADTETHKQYWLKDTISGATYNSIHNEDTNQNELTINIFLKDTANDSYPDSPNYTATAIVSGNSFSCDLTDVLRIASNTNANKYIKVTYEATVTGLKIENDASFDDGTNDGKFGSDSDKLVTGTVTFTKTGANSVKLNNAVFVLKKDNQYAKFTQEPDGIYTLKGWSSTITDETKLTTQGKDSSNNDLGQFIVQGLEKGVGYEFEEIQAPSGYSINKNNASITWTGYTEDTMDNIPSDLDNVIEGTASMTDTTLADLPSTGGMGTTLFTIAGCVIMISAAGLFFATRKKAN